MFGALHSLPQPAPLPDTAPLPIAADIKSSNVLLTAAGTAKLGDVAFSRLQTGTFLSDLQGHLLGTFAWVRLGSLFCCAALPAAHSNVFHCPLLEVVAPSALVQVAPEILMGGQVGGGASAL